MSHFYYIMYFLFFFSLTFFFFLVSFSLSPKRAITPLLIYNTLTNFFLASLSNAYFLLPQHYQQTIKQSNALYIITSHLISQFLNSNTPTQQLQNIYIYIYRQIETCKSQTQSHIQIQFTIIFKNK